MFMKKYSLLILFILPAFAQLAAFTNQKASLKGKVTDKETGQSLPGVAIYFPDLKTGTITDRSGRFFINDLPAAKVIVKVSFIGYATVTQVVDLSQHDSIDFVLEESPAEMSELVVIGLSQATEQLRSPSPISVISSEELTQNSSSNLMDAIAKEPGISQVSTGTGISKPVIRGLGYNRVVVVNDGIRQEGQQWGDEHGVEIDEYSVSKVEILKGPASLAYGSDAMAGVINMVSAPTLPVGEVKGEVLAAYHTSNGLFGASANITGNVKGFIWDARFSRKMAHDYRNKYDGHVYNSGFEETNFKAILGVNKSWGYSHLHLSSYFMQPEIAEGERDSASGKFIRSFVLNDSTATDTIVGKEDFKSYTQSLPRQEVLQRKIVSNNVFFIKRNRLNVILGWQQNSRKEFADIFNPDAYELYFLLNSLHYDLRFVFPERNGMQLAAGINGMKQHSQNKGEEFLVPEYNLFDFGAYFTLRKTWEKAELSGGARFDSRDVSTAALFLDGNEEPAAPADTGITQKFEDIDRTFSNATGSLGFSYFITKKLYTKLNASKGFRSPNIAELGSNGIHEGTQRYLIGNADMKAETSWQFDYALGFNSRHVTAELDLFSNMISNYIYLARLQSAFGGDSIVDPAEPVQTFKYAQGNATLNGGEFILDVHPHPLDWLHFKNSFSFVNAMQKNAADSAKYLPFTPAPRFTSELKAEFRKAGKFLRNFFARIGGDVFFKQDKVYYAYNTETATPGYTLLNLGLGADLVKGEKTLLSLIFNVNNVLDVAYQSHLSRLKYAPVNYATGRMGIYNMGRNFSVKLIVPFTIKKRKTEEEVK